jgi:hypothetical protein
MDASGLRHRFIMPSADAPNEPCSIDAEPLTGTRPKHQQDVTESRRTVRVRVLNIGTHSAGVLGRVSVVGPESLSNGSAIAVDLPHVPGGGRP